MGAFHLVFEIEVADSETVPGVVGPNLETGHSGSGEQGHVGAVSGAPDPSGVTGNLSAGRSGKNERGKRGNVVE